MAETHQKKQQITAALTVFRVQLHSQSALKREFLATSEDNCVGL